MGTGTAVGVDDAITAPVIPSIFLRMEDFDTLQVLHSAVQCSASAVQCSVVQCSVVQLGISCNTSNYPIMYFAMYHYRTTELSVISN